MTPFKRPIYILFICWMITHPLKASTPPLIIVSLDGGGVRGLIEAIILEELEQQLQTPLISLADIMVGTSTGGLISLALSAPGPNKTILYRPKDLVHLYTSEMKNIFDDSLVSRFKRTFGLWRTKYSVDYFDQWLTKQFRSRLLRETLIPTAVTTYNTTRAEPVLLNSTDQSLLYGYMTLKGAARATTAAPLYFDPYHWKKNKLLDGGIYANNPSLLGLKYARDLFPQQLSYTIVSLGTGAYRHPTYQGGGAFTGGVNMLQQLLHMPEQLVPYHLNLQGSSVTYYRLQPKLSKKISLDDTNQNAYLIKTAKKATQSPMFKKILALFQQKKDYLAANSGSA